MHYSNIPIHSLFLYSFPRLCELIDLIFFFFSSMSGLSFYPRTSCRKYGVVNKGGQYHWHIFGTTLSIDSIFF